MDGHLAEFEHALYSRDFKDPDKGYAAYIDVDSFIDVHLHVEICRNIDGIRLSTYYHKDREGKINMGPVWDYNLSLGNTTMREGQYPDGWYHHTIHDREYTYFARLFEDPGFELRYWDRYYQLRKTMFSKARLAEQIRELTRELSESQERNFRKWQILGMPVWIAQSPYMGSASGGADVSADATKGIKALADLETSGTDDNDIVYGYAIHESALYFAFSKEAKMQASYRHSYLSTLVTCESVYGGAVRNADSDGERRIFGLVDYE